VLNDKAEVDNHPQPV